MPTKTITKTEQGEVLFLSSKPELRLVRRPSQSIYSAVGTYAGEVQGSRVIYDFSDHQLRVRPGQDVLPDGPVDESGVPAMQDAISWLRSHPAFNGGEANAFHEHGKEPARVPDPGVTLKAITDAAIFGDTDAIEEILSDERAEWNRPVVVQQAEAALESVRAAVEQASAGDGPENA